MNLLALDLSLTSTGWAAKHGAEPVAFGTWCPKETGTRRLAAAVSWIDKMLDVFKPDLVMVEGYSFNSRNTHAHGTGELGGVIRLHVWNRRVAIVEFAPKCRAKLATGKGNAGKDQVLVEAVKRLGYQGHSNDEADALWILQGGLLRYGQPGAIRLPQAHIAALDGVDWPSDLMLQRAS